MDYNKILSNIFFSTKYRQKFSVAKYNKLVKFKNHYPNILNYLETIFNNFNSYKETLYRIKYNVIDIPTCKSCGCQLKMTFKPHKLYRDFCSTKCSNSWSEKIKHYENLCLEKYGVKSSWCQEFSRKKAIETFKSKECQERRNQTMKNHYGMDYFATEECRIKIINRMNELYGVDSALSLKSTWDKIKQTNLQKYNVEYWVQSTEGRKILSQLLSSEETKNKSKQTNLDRYGSEYWTKSNEGKKILSQLLSSEEIKNKIKQTNLDRYGSEYWSRSDDGRKILSGILSSIEIINKINATKRKNKSFNKSIDEELSFIMLKNKFKNVERQYFSSRYPFACDFYIPSLDLFIECNYHWTHGGKPYESSKEDNLILESWKQKKTKYYDNAINTWTIRDPKKRFIAKQNKINFLEFFKINQLKEWLDKY